MVLDVTMLQVVAAASSIFIVSRILKLIQGLKAVNYHPGRRIPFWPLAMPGAILPTTWWNVGMKFPWQYRFSAYSKDETFSIVPWLAGPPGFYTSSLEVARQVIGGGHKSDFVKPEHASRALLYNLVWEQTLRTYREMITAEGWENADVAEVPVVQKLTFKLALLVLGHCAFGFPFDWSTPARLPDGSMSVQEALRTVADTHIFAISAPKWVWKLPIKWIQDSRVAHEQLARFMREQVEERKEALTSDVKGALGRDAFSMLVAANESENQKLQLSDQELIGNVFIMLFAGHETTAHTLAATLGFLSLYPDIQEDVVQQITKVVGRDRDPTMEDYPKLTKVTAVFYESLRMFPAGHLMIREAHEDTVITMPNPVGVEGSKEVPIPKGTQVVVDMVGVQYNPRYFDEPEKFKPSRWEGVSNESESFTAFSVGPRMCLGRGETKDTWRARVMDANLVLTLGVANVPVKLIRRNKGGSI
ncbi:hypothetical protein ONZ45_g4924 [Pleurotus djamor]|nr:hypothetical protein ONZ45_g4924 [Pleurotus djamor]